MADKEKTAYETLSEVWGEYRHSLDLLQSVSQGRHNQDLPKICAEEVYRAGEAKVKEAIKKGEDPETAKRKYLEDEVAAIAGNPQAGIKPSTDPYVLFPWLKVREDRTKKDFDSFGKNNLEAIINSTPEEALEALFQVYLNPKDNKDPHYKDVAKMHDEFKKMTATLRSYMNREIPEDQKSKIKGEMDDKLIKYYKGIYKDKGEKVILEALTALVTYNTQIAVQKYKTFIEWKHEDIEKQLDTKDKKAAYVMATLPSKDPLKPYNAMFNDIYQQQHSQAA